LKFLEIYTLDCHKTLNIYLSIINVFMNESSNPRMNNENNKENKNNIYNNKRNNHDFVTVKTKQLLALVIGLPAIMGMIVASPLVVHPLWAQVLNNNTSIQAQITAAPLANPSTGQAQIKAAQDKLLTAAPLANPGAGQAQIKAAQGVLTNPSTGQAQIKAAQGVLANPGAGQAPINAAPATPTQAGATDPPPSTGTQPTNNPTPFNRVFPTIGPNTGNLMLLPPPTPALPTVIFPPFFNGPIAPPPPPPIPTNPLSFVPATVLIGGQSTFGNLLLQSLLNKGVTPEDIAAHNAAVQAARDATTQGLTTSINTALDRLALTGTLISFASIPGDLLKVKEALDLATKVGPLEAPLLHVIIAHIAAANSITDIISALKGTQTTTPPPTTTPPTPTPTPTPTPAEFPGGTPVNVCKGSTGFNTCQVQTFPTGINSCAGPSGGDCCKSVGQTGPVASGATGGESGGGCCVAVASGTSPARNCSLPNPITGNICMPFNPGSQFC
jgi:hypothetical protein